MNRSWTVAHDFAFHFGGAERVTSQLHEALGGGEVRLLAGNRQTITRMGIFGCHRYMSPTWVNEGNYRPLAVMHAITALSSPVVEGNLLASSYGFAHMLRSEGAKVVYCHSPLRQAWSGVREYSRSMGGLKGSAWRYGASPVIRGLDKHAVKSVDRFIATSRAVQSRIRSYYGRDSVIIPPPVDDVFVPSLDSDALTDNFVWAGRVVEPYKKLGMLVEAFRSLPDRTLTVAGEGRDLPAIQKIAPPNVKFIGEVDTNRLAILFREAAGVFMPSEDDFGMVAAEAIASGTPVIAFAGGGALDTITPGVSGVLYGDSTSRGILQGVQDFDATSWNRAEVAKCGERFRAANFRATIRDYLSGL